jgi:MerR HTH family regulatory protein
LGGLSFAPKRNITNDDVINPATKAVSNEMVATPSRWLQLFDPPADAVYTIESAARLTGVPRRTILVYCKHRLLSPLLGTGVGGYSFDGDGIRSLHRIEALRTVCGDDFAGIRIILDLTKELERLQAGPSRTGVFRST